MNVNEVSEICKVLSDPHRIQILQMLVDGEKCASELLEKFTISQPTLSHHMKSMTDSGMIQEKKKGKRTYYSINRQTWDEFMLVLDTISSTDYWPWFPPAVLKETAEAKVWEEAGGKAKKSAEAEQPAAEKQQSPQKENPPEEKQVTEEKMPPVKPEAKQSSAMGKSSRRRAK